MLVAARHIRAFMDDVTEDAFLADDLRQSAVLHQMTILGEAAKRVSEPFRAAHPQIAWPAMAALRNRIVHEYDDISIDKVWNSATREVPELIAALESIIPAEPDGEEDGE